jgi:peroxiredoxin
MEKTEEGIWGELSNQLGSSGDLKIGLSVAALILGIVSIAMAIIVTGAVFGLIGAILGISSLAGKSVGKKMAGWGLGLSIVGILLSCFFALAYYSAHVQMDKSIGDIGEHSSSFDKWIGQDAPDFEVTDIEGNHIKLSELRGKRVVVNFWRPLSLRSRDAIPHFIKLRKTIPEEKLMIIGISSADAEELKGVGELLGINYPLVSSKELPSPFDVRWKLTTFFIDQNGVIQSVLDVYHSFEKINSAALAENYEKYEAQESQVLKSTSVSDD